MPISPVDLEYLDDLRRRQAKAHFSLQLCEKCEGLALVIVDVLRRSDDRSWKYFYPEAHKLWSLNIEACALCGYFTSAIKIYIPNFTKENLQHFNIEYLRHFRQDLQFGE